ncbi:MAG: TrkH family potassium uptake protein [Bacteroidota bacterium]
MNLKWRIILNILGLLLGLNGLFMLLGIPFSLYYGDGDLLALLVSGGATTAFGAGMWFFTRGDSRGIRKREGYVIVSLGWIVMSLSGCLPYILSGTIPDFAGAFFETLSGYTTTGASVLTDIEAAPKGILFWRSVTHWIGGMGIIVLTIAILPILGIGGMQLFMAESPGPSADKLHPRIQETAKRLWLLYVALTAVETIFLMLGGVSFYESICHAFATVSTGGFSTRNASVAAFGPYVQWVIIGFMFLSGINFTLTFWGLRGKLDKIWKNEEFRYYLGLILIATVVVAAGIVYNQGEFTERAVRDALFQVVAVVTTTGFVTADFTVWSPLITVIFFLLFFTGGSAGSTAGGVKIVRHIIILKNSFLEFRRLIHPNAVVPVRLHKKAVTNTITFNVLAFFMIYLGIFAVGALVMAIILPDVSGMEGSGETWHRFSTAVGASASCIGNVGPGFAGVGPVENYAWIPAGGKLFLAFQMLIGRLELFTVLILFSPSFWRKN